MLGPVMKVPGRPKYSFIRAARSASMRPAVRSLGAESLKFLAWNS
jgi:hypothetical protein